MAICPSTRPEMWARSGQNFAREIVEAGESKYFVVLILRNLLILRTASAAITARPAGSSYKNTYNYLFASFRFTRFITSRGMRSVLRGRLPRVFALPSLTTPGSSWKSR